MCRVLLPLQCPGGKVKQGEFLISWKVLLLIPLCPRLHTIHFKWIKLSPIQNFREAVFKLPKNLKYPKCTGGQTWEDTRVMDKKA